MSSNIDIIMAGYANLVDQTTIDTLGSTSYSSGDSIRKPKKFMRATGSCCLVRTTGKLNILFDTLGPWERDLLIERLAKLNLHPDDIHYLVCSHNHPDHVGNLNLFSKAKLHFVGTSVYSQDLYDLNYFELKGSYTFTTAREEVVEVPTFEVHKFDDNISLEPTPGHTLECTTMIVKNCDNYGTVGLVGDLFEREEDVSDESIWLAAGSQNSNLQRAHRSCIYKQVDYILPGHGPLFKVVNADKDLWKQ